MSTETSKEMSATKQWGIGIILAILGQFLGLVWYASAYVSKVDTLQAEVTLNTQHITTLENNSPIIITRDQLNDILQVRDTRLNGIEKSVSRIEDKIDRIIK